MVPTVKGPVVDFAYICLSMRVIQHRFACVEVSSELDGGKKPLPAGLALYLR